MSDPFSAKAHNSGDGRAVVHAHAPLLKWRAGDLGLAIRAPPTPRPHPKRMKFESHCHSFARLTLAERTPRVRCAPNTVRTRQTSLGCALLSFQAIALAGCLEASPRSPETADWKRRTPAATNVSDISLGPGRMPQRQNVTAIFDPFWSTCYASFAPTTDPVSDLDRLGFACGSPRGFAPAAPVHAAAQKMDEPHERLVFRARTGRCYRFFAIGNATIRDLDIAILAPDGRLVAADLSKDSWSVVPPRAPWCPEEEGPFAVDISVADGEGEYALGVWAADPQ